MNGRRRSGRMGRWNESGAIQVLKQSSNGHLQHGVDGFGGDLGQGLKNESSLVHERVGNDQFLAADDHVAVKKKIDVDQAGFPFLAADAAKLVFDFKNAMKQGVRTKSGLYFGGGVEKGGRIRCAA